ncbi:MAG TPA: ATP-binding protein [Chitinophagales bacterium]|nr:ATP-binding protein [Chitinophagales bacterium]HRK25765.1 ATP-binding protein [Chitinophagales bacterium]
MKQIKYQTSCSKDRLGEIRHFVSQQLQELPINDIEKNQIILAIDEACANAIIHGNNCDENKQLNVILHIEDTNIDIEISDVGQYDPETDKITTPDPILDALSCSRKGGLGLPLIHRIMDTVNFYRKDKVHVCSLSKRFKRD